jgi:hypothetical protein
MGRYARAMLTILGGNDYDCPESDHCHSATIAPINTLEFCKFSSLVCSEEVWQSKSDPDYIQYSGTSYINLPSQTIDNYSNGGAIFKPNEIVSLVFSKPSDCAVFSTRWNRACQVSPLTDYWSFFYFSARSPRLLFPRIINWLSAASAAMPMTYPEYN